MPSIAEEMEEVRIKAEPVQDEDNEEDNVPTPPVGVSPWAVAPLKVGDVLEEESLEENRNLGARRRDSNDNLFEIVADCVISSGGREDGSGDGVLGKGLLPTRVLSAVGGGSESLGIVLDSELVILDKDQFSENRSDKLRRVQFGATIDFILWRRSIILVGLSSSEIVLLDPGSFRVRESRKVSDTLGRDRFFVQAALHSNPDPSKIDVLAVGVDGVIYSFNNISLSDGTLDSTQDQNISLDIDLGTVRGTRIKCLDNEDAEVLCAASPSRSILILGQANGMMSLHDVEVLAGVRKEIFAAQSVNVIENLEDENPPGNIFIKKVVPFEGLLFILLSDGRLEIYLDDVLFPTKPLQLPESPSEPYICHDFALLLNGEGEVKLWALYGTADYSVNFVGIFGTPSFISEFSVKIPKLALAKDGRVTGLQFPSQATNLEEPFAFLQVSTSSQGSRDVVLFRMLETSTEATISKLLARGKFGQAAVLARLYNKDLDIVFKAQARFKFNEVQTLGGGENEGGKAGTVFQEFVATLEKIREPNFVCDFCSKRAFHSMTWIRRLLALGKGRVKDCSGSESGKSLLLTLKKLYTFEQVFPSGGIEKWLTFSSPSNTMFQQCQWFLNKLEFGKCEKVWRRHFDEFIPLLKLDDFGPFFFALFSQKLSSPPAISLTKCILPFAVEKCAETGSSATDTPNQSYDSSFLNPFQLGKVGLLLNIVKRQVCSLEREMSWPEGAKTFCGVVISIVKEAMGGLDTGLGSREGNLRKEICLEILDRLETIVQNLVELGQLRTNHSIRIPFTQYMEDDVIEVVNAMLAELVEKPEIERFITKFLVPFAERKDIQIDSLYFKHIEAVVSDLPFRVNSNDIPQEARLICLISHIASAQYKLAAVCKIAEEWPVPWSQPVDAMVLSVLRINVEREEELAEIQNKIKIMRIQVPFRVLLNKYRLTATKCQNYNGVVMAVSRIIYQARPEYYQDCLEFVKHTGKVDEQKIRGIEFNIKLKGTTPIEDLVPLTYERPLLKRLLAGVLGEFRMSHLEILTATELSRIESVGKLLANRLDDRKALEFLQLRELLPSLKDPDLVYDENYPFCVLNWVMPLHYNKVIPELVAVCRQVCNITRTRLADVLSATAAYFARPGASPSELDKAWDLTEKITSSPGAVLSQSSSLVHSSAMTVAQFLLSHAPSASDARLGVLSQFLTILAEYDKTLMEVTKMMGVLRIFLAIREQEIPLEKEYLQIYVWLFVDGIPSEEKFSKALNFLGGTILKFGDRNLFKQVFGSVVKELFSRIGGTSSEELKGSIKKLIKGVKEVQADLYRSADRLVEPEKDRQVLHLVECLKTRADLMVTPYALRKRDKGRLLDKLLNVNHYSLAAQTAIVFEYYEDTAAWSRILQGFMGAGNLAELKKVMLQLRNISQLWMLPEFAKGWKMVAVKEAAFLDLCPIPLED